MWLFSLGPTPTLMGNPLMYRGPYSLLMYLPGFNSLRVPARFWMTTTLCLAVIGAIVFDRLASRLGRTRMAMAAIVAIGVLGRHMDVGDAAGGDAEAVSALSCAGRHEGTAPRAAAGVYVS